MRITRTYMCELPFILNLPNGTYTLPLGGAPYELQLNNGLAAIHIGQLHYAVNTPEQLRAAFADHASHYMQPLRTVLGNEMTREIPDSELPAVGDAELLEDLASEVSGEMLGSGDAAACAAEAKRRLDLLCESQRAERVARGAAMRYGRSRMRPAHEEFLMTCNALIRLYMERFDDSFVETITIDHVAAMAPMHGVTRQIFLDGKLVDFSGIVGAIPPVMRGPWIIHPTEQTNKFLADLAAGAAPDSFRLMSVRANAFLKRGANRSAINEASAAIDFVLGRKIRAGYAKQGMPEPEVTDKMKKHRNFEDRAKKLLKEATGTSAPELDNTVWEAVSKHRARLRQETAHSDAEPSAQDAADAVRDFLNLAGRIDRIVLP